MPLDLRRVVARVGQDEGARDPLDVLQGERALTLDLLQPPSPLPAAVTTRMGSLN